MHRIYQGRVNGVEIPQSQTQSETPAKKKAGKKSIEWQPLPALADGEAILWQHHQLFQDAVNYYIVALASLGESEKSPLTKLRGLLGSVWAVADKKGQTREGLGKSLCRAWALDNAPTLDEAIAKFHKSFTNNATPLSTTEKAGEYLLSKMGGDGAIQQGGPSYWPRFCWAGFKGNYDLTADQMDGAAGLAKLVSQIHAETISDAEIVSIAREASPSTILNLGLVAKLQHTAPYQGEEALDRIRLAHQIFADKISAEELEKWIKQLPKDFAIPRNNKCNKEKSAACILFLAFPNQTTKSIFQSTFRAPKPVKEGTKGTKKKAEPEEAKDYRVNGDDPIKVARGKRGFVFEAFTALPIWDGTGSELAWKEFDIAAFKEALKTYNQFNQNVKNREEKLAGLAMRLLAMDGEKSWTGYAEDYTVAIRLKNLWAKCAGKPTIQSDEKEGGEGTALPSFDGDSRIDRLRKIINDELAEEYRLTDGKKTAYGLRKRTIKGWSEVSKEWQKIVKQKPFSEDLKKKLQKKLDEMRSGEKKETIGSHLFFEALISDGEAWTIWREPSPDEVTQIESKNWSKNPINDFRIYCETREAIEEISARPLNFTPADARYSRRLFSFTDVCSFGKTTGEYRHDSKGLFVTVPVATKNTSGKYCQQKIRLAYSAPRLLRDKIRSADGAYAQDWVQPMVKAILGEQAENKQSLEDAAVQLMPDFTRDGTLRILLNFPVAVDETPIKNKIGKSQIWDKQFMSWKNGKQLPFLRWAGDFKADDKAPHRWWKDAKSFRVLAADLGTRHAACVATIECSKIKKDTSRFIGKVNGSDWYARFTSGKVLRLPGENVAILRPLAKGEKDNKSTIAFREELFGSRGRSASIEECRTAKTMLDRVGQAYMLEDTAEDLAETFSFPEVNDKLLVGLRRAQNTLATYIRWHWKLTNQEVEGQKEATIKQISEQDKNGAWQKLAQDGKTKVLADTIRTEIVQLRKNIQIELLSLTARILPLRGRGWEWAQHPDKADCHILRETEMGSAPEEVKIRGQRGLSMARIEQLGELRRRWQSLNQALRREIGSKPLTASEMRNDPIPDPCPDILVKLENIREQRVNQTAHLIIARALGLRLKADKMSSAERLKTDLHGEYEKATEPVDFIVLEDLNRYLADQGRAKSENSRLMKWCHRAVLDKVKMLAEPFGIEVLETPAAYSSRFCSLTGIAGFRAVEVSLADKTKFRWRKALDEVAEAEKVAQEKLTAGQIDALGAKKLFDNLAKLPAKTTLLAPQAGGPIFITAKEVSHIKGNGSVVPMQADINAAINLALRAVASPDCADIHHRLRTEFKPDKKGSKTGKHITREARRFPDAQAIEIKTENSLPAERNSNLFYDPHGVADFGRARLAGKSDYAYASGQGIWKAANDRAKQWTRCEKINQGHYPTPIFAPDDDLPM